MKTFSFEEALSTGWKYTLRYFTVFLVASLAVIIVEIPIQLFTHDKTNTLGPIWGIVALVAWILSILFSIGVMVMSLKAVDGKQPEITDLYDHGNLLGNYLLASIMYFLLVGVGTLFFVLPGIYFAMKYQLYPYFVIDKKVSAMDALRLSGEATKGVKLRLFIWGFVIAVVNALGFLALGLGLLFTIPTTWIAHAKIYRDLSK